MTLIRIRRIDLLDYSWKAESKKRKQERRDMSMNMSSIQSLDMQTSEELKFINQARGYMMKKP